MLITVVYVLFGMIYLYVWLYGHFSLILLGEMVINRNSSWRNQTFLSPLLFFFETTRRLCRRVVSEDVPAILSLYKPIKNYIKWGSYDLKFGENFLLGLPYLPIPSRTQISSNKP